MLKTVILLCLTNATLAIISIVRFDYDLRWRQNGRSLLPRKQPQYMKIHFAIMTQNGQSSEFKKFVFKRLHDEGNFAAVIVHYVGNEAVYTDYPHGKYIPFCTWQ